MKAIPEFKRGKLIASHPAWDIYEAKPQQHLSLQLKRPTFAAGDVIGLPFDTKRYGILHNWFQFGSSVSYALQYNEDPISAYAQSYAKREKTHWLNLLPSVVCDTQKEKEIRVACDWDAEIIFEGRLFKITKAPNSNADLKDITKP